MSSLNLREKSHLRAWLVSILFWALALFTSVYYWHLSGRSRTAAQIDRGQRIKASMLKRGGSSVENIPNNTLHISERPWVREERNARTNILYPAALERPEYRRMLKECIRADCRRDYAAKYRVMNLDPKSRADLEELVLDRMLEEIDVEQLTDVHSPECARLENSIFTRYREDVIKLLGETRAKDFLAMESMPLEINQMANVAVDRMDVMGCSFSNEQLSNLYSYLSCKDCKSDREREMRYSGLVIENWVKSLRDANVSPQQLDGLANLQQELCVLYKSSK